MKTKLFTLMLLASVGLLACKTQSIKESTIVSYGTSFGMCVNYCKQSIVVETTKVTFTKTKNGKIPDPKTCEKVITNEEFKTITAAIDKNKFDKLQEVIGCPDCADGGAEWVEVSQDGKKKRVTFEYGKAPEELKNAVAKLKELKESFANCN